MPSEPGDALAPGDTIGRYQLASLLASGGMGQVWIARPIGTGFARAVALKLVRAEMSGDENYARMFVDEATVASSIHHPNVCETYELGKQGDRLFMAMEWVAGDSLAGLLRQGDSLVALDLRIAARIIADACAGLHAAHETVGADGTLLGVVHRDISPPNILISLQGQAKVSDFGIAKARYQLHERTKTGEVKGKFAYIPPEQISGGAVDRRADVYAMGCVLYVATLGSRPFGNGADALRKILSNEYKAPHELRPDFPEGLQAIIKKALAPAPDARFASAEDMQMALEEWLMASGKLVTASDVAKCVKERINPEVRAHIDALMSQNRVAPERLMRRLVSSYENETPTAGTGSISTHLSVAKAAAFPPSETGADVSVTMTDPLLLRASAERRVTPPRASDATALVSFVPHGAEAPAIPVERAADPGAPAEAPPPAYTRAKLWLAVLLAVAVLLVLWLALAR